MAPLAPIDGTFNAAHYCGTFPELCWRWINASEISYSFSSQSAGHSPASGTLVMLKCFELFVKLSMEFTSLYLNAGRFWDPKLVIQFTWGSSLSGRERSHSRSSFYLGQGDWKQIISSPASTWFRFQRTESQRPTKRVVRRWDSSILQDCLLC